MSGCTDSTTANVLSGYDVRRRAGINIHQSAFGHNQTHAQQAALIAAAGFGWVRLGVHIGNTAAQVVANVSEYLNRGISYTLLPAAIGLSNVVAINPIIQAAMASLDPTYCLGLENINEIPNNAQGWSDAQAQHANLVAMRAAVPGWGAVPILAPSFSGAAAGIGSAHSVLAPAVAMNNWHEYSRPGGIGDVDFETGLARDKVGPFIANNQILFGEFGYPHGATPDGTNVEIIDTAAGILLSRTVLYCLSFRSILLNSLYELMDEPTLGTTEARMGIVGSTGTAKSSYTQLSRLLNLIGETTTSTPSHFTWSTSGGTSWDSRGVSTLAVQKANGRRYMCLWNAVNVVTNPSGGGATFVSGDLAIPAGTAATVTFDRSFTTINRYAPYLGAGIQATTSGSSWTGDAQAYVQVLELIP